MRQVSDAPSSYFDVCAATAAVYPTPRRLLLPDCFAGLLAAPHAGVSRIVGQQAEGVVVGKRMDGAEVSAIECQYGVGAELRCNRHVDGISEVQMQVDVAFTNCLGSVEGVGRHLG